MIADSIPWREQLRSIAIALRRRSHQKRWTERTHFLVERDLMFGAYAIRRLIESNKTSSRLPDRRIRVTTYRLVGRVPMSLDRSDLSNFYDLTRGQPAEIDVAFLCNQIIHSFLFQMWDEENGSTTVAFASDRARNSLLYSTSLDVIAGLFDYVGREDVVRMRGSMRSGTQTWDRFSNHDLVESGAAKYVDESRTETDWVAPDSGDLRRELLTGIPLDTGI